MNLETGAAQIDLMGAVRRRGMIVAAVSGAVFLAAYWIAMALPNQYDSYTTLLVEPQAVSERLVEAGAGDTDLNNRLHLMTAQILSRPRLSRIIDELDLFQRESQTMLREEVISLMRERIRVVPILPQAQAGVRRTEVNVTTFQVWYSSSDPAQAAQVAQRVAKDFIEKHISARVEITQKSLEFITAEQSRQADAIGEVDAEIARIKGENPGRLPEQMGPNQALLARTISDLRVAQRDVDVARSDSSFWGHQSLAEATGAIPRDDASPGRRLKMLELGLAELRSRGFTDKHPDVIQTLQEVEEVRIQIKSDEHAADEESDDAPMSLAQQTAQGEQQRAKARVATTEAEIRRLEIQLEDIQRRIGETPRVAEQLEALERRREQLALSLHDFTNRRLEATVQADLERRQLGEQFRILEAAFPPTQPSSPNRMMIIVIGLMVGIVLGLGVGVLAESTDSSIHGPRQLQNALGMPVLASIPIILLESDRARNLRRRLRNTVAATALVVMCLVGGAVTYLYVNGAPGFLKATQIQTEPAEPAADDREARAARAAQG